MKAGNKVAVLHHGIFFTDCAITRVWDNQEGAVVVLADGREESKLNDDIFNLPQDKDRLLARIDEERLYLDCIKYRVGVICGADCVHA